MLVVIEISLMRFLGNTLRAPSVTLLLAIYCGVRWGAHIGAISGFFLMLLTALLRYEPLGASTLIGTLVGFSAGYFSGKLYVGYSLALMFIVGLLIFCAEIINGALQYFLFNNFTPPDWLWVGINTGCSLPLFYLFELIFPPGARPRYLMHLK